MVAIPAHPSGSGYYAVVDPSVFDKHLFRQVCQISDMKEEN
jgi:hypothetical protein